MRGSLPLAKVQPDQHTFGIRQVADDFLDRRGQPAHQRRQRQDLVAPPQLRIFEQVDDFDAVAPREVLVADLAQVRERAHRLRRLPGDVEPEVERLVLHVIVLCGRRTGTDVDPVVREPELPHLVRVRHAARLQHIDPAPPAALDLLGGGQHPRVHERRDHRFGGFAARRRRTSGS